MDAIDLSGVRIDGSPDVRQWPATVTLTRADLDPVGGFSLTFDRPIPESWKWYTGNGPDNYQYTVWLIVPLPDGYHAAGLIQMWQGRPMGDGSLPSVLRHYGADGWLGHLGGAMASYQPTPGDVIGMFVTAGNARGVTTQTSVAERSTVVSFALPASDRGSWSASPVPQPAPPSSDPVPAPPPDLASINARLDALTAAILAVGQQLAQQKAPNYVGDTTVPILGHVTVVLKPQGQS